MNVFRWFYRFGKKTPQKPKELICEGCGQVWSTLDDGFCAWCSRYFKAHK